MTVGVGMTWFYDFTRDNGKKLEVEYTYNDNTVEIQSITEKTDSIEEPPQVQVEGLEDDRLMQEIYDQEPFPPDHSWDDYYWDEMDGY